MNLNIWQTIVLALLQGVTELFPISSLGHTVILPGLFGWGNLVTDTGCGGQSCFLPLIVALHLGTSLALVLYFWRDWVQVGRTLLTSMQSGEVRTGTEEWVSWLILIGSIPAGLLGLFLETPLKQLFASPIIASAFLVVNGSLLFAGERMIRSREGQARTLSARAREAQGRSLSSLSWKEVLVVGLAQSLALLPGISRSGVTMVAGLGMQLSHEDAAHFSFLLGTPLIGAAALLEVPQLIGQPASTLLLVGVGMVLAGVAAYLSTRFLMRYFQTGRLDPFAYYCWGTGLVALIVLLAVLHVGT